MIDPDHELSIENQCALLEVPRSTYYYEAAGESPENLALMEQIDMLYLAPVSYTHLTLPTILRV